MKFTREDAITLYKSEWWRNLKEEHIVRVQLFEDRLCMPMDLFHAALEKVLDRPVYSHEFAFPERLQKEYLGEKPKPTPKEILELIPMDKRIILWTKKRSEV